MQYQPLNEAGDISTIMMNNDTNALISSYIISMAIGAIYSIWYMK